MVCVIGCTDWELQDDRARKLTGGADVDEFVKPENDLLIVVEGEEKV